MFKMGFGRLKARHRRAVLLLGALGQNLFPCLFPVSGSSLYSLAHGPLLHLQSQQRDICQSLSD